MRRLKRFVAREVYGRLPTRNSPLTAHMSIGKGHAEIAVPVVIAKPLSTLAGT